MEVYSESTSSEARSEKVIRKKNVGETTASASNCTELSTSLSARDAKTRERDYYKFVVIFCPPFLGIYF